MDGKWSNKGEERVAETQEEQRADTGQVRHEAGKESWMKKTDR